jgi:uncharacterized SAM-binding protein YcdF (DUF218 family)
MFFLLSKLLALLLKPLNIMAMLGLYALFSRNPVHKRRSYVLLVVLLIFFSNPWIINELARQWEIGQVNPENITQPYDVGILLGGYTDMSAAQPAGVVSFSHSANRLTGTLALYKTGKIKKILLSGGSGRIVGEERAEAPIVRWYLQQAGVPDSAILTEDRSRNTWENAVFSKHLLDSIAPNSRCLLITSAWHLRRAKGCFEKAGQPCAIFGTDFFTELDLGNPYNWLEPDWQAFMKWDALLKEWTGWIVYRVSGKG